MPPEDFIERIDLLVHDENRIVSYKILSHELKIHVNKAKQCLEDFVNIQKQKGIELTIHYFIAGFIQKDGVRTNKVIIVPEDKLESAKENFSEITSFHIYSIFNGDSKDECALYSADFSYIKEKGNQNKYAAIKHPNIEIQPPVLNKILINPDPKPCINQKMFPKSLSNGTSSSETKNDLKSTVVKNTISPEKSDKSEESTKESKGNKTSPEEKKQKTGSLMSLWQKKDDKTNGVKKENSKAEAKGKEAPKAAAKNNIMSMFSKQAAKNADKPPVVKTPPVTKKESPKKTPPVIEKEEIKKEKTLENKKASQKRKAHSKNSKQPSKNKRDSDSDNEFETKSKKKRRRICTFDDSSSESESEEAREKEQRSFFLPEDPMDTVQETLKSEDEEPIPPTPPVIHVKGKAKIWKTVQKTFEDEEGFFVTKTEKELVSASEDEEDSLKVKEKKKEEAVNKKSISVNKKQSSLMSFFKQK